MVSPFRYNKKQRKYYRKRAKANLEAAKKFEAEGTKSQFVDVSRMLADFDTKMSLAKRRKKRSKKAD